MLEKSNEQRYLESSEYQRTVSRAKERLSFKTFTELYSGINTIAKIGQIFFPVLSVVFSVAFVLTWFSFMNIFLALVIAVLLLAFIEALKYNVSHKSWQMYYTNIGNPKALGAVALLLSGASFVISYNGAAELVVQMTDKTQVIEAHTTNKGDSIMQYYDVQKAIQQRKIDSISALAANQYMKLNTPKQDEQKSQILESIASLETQKIKALDMLHTDKQELKQEAKENTFVMAHWNKILAAFIEVLLIVFLWFTNFYDYKTVQENEDLSKLKKKGTPETETEIPSKTETKTISTPGATLSHSAGSYSLPPDKSVQKIGFVTMQKNAVSTAYATHTDDLSETDIQYLAKHKHIVRSLKNNYPEGLPTLTNEAIRTVQNTLDTDKHNSPALIRKVFVAMQSVGFDRIDNTGSIIN